VFLGMFSAIQPVQALTDAILLDPSGWARSSSPRKIRRIEQYRNMRTMTESTLQNDHKMASEVDEHNGSEGLKIASSCVRISNQRLCWHI
jgi:hypothetical protein